MATGSATADGQDRSLPTGLVAVCLLHFGVGAAAILGGLLLFVRSPIVGLLMVLLGGILVRLAQELREFRRRAWRRTIALHGIDALVGAILLSNGGVEEASGLLVSTAVIVYLYSRRHLFRSVSE